MGALDTPRAPQPIAGENARIRLDLAYDGTDFHGWAAQPGLRTVQGSIEDALAVVTRSPVVLTVAGRTDAGVHASHQVAHLDVPLQAWRRLAPRGADPDDDAAVGAALVRRINGLLARSYSTWCRDRSVNCATGTSDAVIADAARVDASFDARFSALGRHYCYRLVEGVPDPLRRRDVLAVGETLDLDAMNEAASALLGEHDFLSYCRPREGATTIRTLTRLDASRAGGVVEVRVAADAFCHSMVRSLVGALLPVGRGVRETTWPKELLDARSRASAAPIAPAHGLTLEGVDYPPPSQWAKRAAVARARRDCTAST